MTGPRLVERGERGAPGTVAAALDHDQVIVVPGRGGYQLAARRDGPSAMAAFGALAPALARGSAVQVAVGRIAQAVALTPDWSDVTKRVTDRHWPGPLTVMVPARDGGGDGGGDRGGDRDVTGPLYLTMPSERRLRRWCRDSGPLALAALRGADGQPLTLVDEVWAHCGGTAVALIVDGGSCPGPGPTVVDCRVSPPQVRQVGALPAVYIEAALALGAGRRGWFRRAVSRPPR